MHAALPRPRLRFPRLLALSLGLGLVTLLSSCDDPSAKSLPVWTPSDHDNQANPGADQTDTEAPRARMPDLEQHGIDDVVLATWKQNCTTCHGLIGRGDGPQAAMFKPPDLTSEAFRKRAIESEIIYTIEKGRGRMPAFGHLPKDTIQGLTRLVLMLSAPPAAAPAAAPGAAAPSNALTAPAPAAPAAGPNAPPAPPASTPAK